MNVTDCIGFGEYDGKCENAAGSSHSTLWCQRCDDLRMTHLSERFDELGRALAAARAGETPA